jgi:hypothetical protein
MAEHSLLQPLPPRIGARGSARQMRVTGHQPARTAANESDHPEHLNRASAKARSDVNGTSSREARDRGEAP